MNKLGIRIKYVDKKADGLEGWIQVENAEWIRLDFVLEFYLFGQMELSNSYRKSNFRNHQVAKEYADGLYQNIRALLASGKEVDFKAYLEWQQNNFSKIQELSNSLNPDKD